MERQDEDFSVVVLASDLGIDARSLLSPAERRRDRAALEAEQHQPEEVEWYDCPSHPPLDDFSDLDALQIFRCEGSDKPGNRILRIVGKYFPALVISGERLKRYVLHKLYTELPEGPFCIVYIHSTARTEENNPGISILRWVYEEIPADYRERLQVLYFVHPGLRSRLLFATLGRLFLSDGRSETLVISEMERQDEDFSVVVLASDLGIDARSLLSPAERRRDRAALEAEQHQPEEVEWHDCPSHPPLDDFSDLDALQIFRCEGSDKPGNRILRIVGKYFPALVISGERLKRYVLHKLYTELPEGPFCIVYIHSTARTEENSPGISILRWVYEEIPADYRERLQVLYFVHPGLRSRLLFATLGRLFLSDGLYWKVKYVSRLEYLWADIKKGQIEIPEFVQRHDEVLEHRPLTDYGIEPDPLHLAAVPAMEYSYGRYEDKWGSRTYM